MESGHQAELGQLNIIVLDMKAAVRFYRLVGLEIDDTRPFSDHHVAVRMANGFLLELDSLEFAPKWNVGFPGAGRGCNVIGFNLPTREAVDDAVARVRDAGYAVQQEPHDAFWGARYAIVEDPDGNSVGLMSPIDAERKSPVPGW